MNANENSHEYLEQLSLFDDILTDYVITKPVRLISFFSGIEAQFKALSVLGHYLNMPIESYKTCEWAYNSIIACNSIHNKDFYPYANHLTKEQIIEKIKGISVNYNEPLSDEQLSKKPLKWLQNAYNNCVANHNLLNIMNVHAEDLEIVDTHRYDYILTYSFPCFLAGHKVLTKNGYKNIEDVLVGENVLTHTNTYQKVLKTMKKYTQEYYKVKYLGGSLELTAEHPLYVLRNNTFQWIKTKDLKMTDMISMNINQNAIDCEYNEKMLWLFGRYLADGYINKHTYHSVNFSIAFQKEEEFLEKTPIEFANRWKKFKKSCWDYRIADTWLNDFLLKEFGTGSKSKRIPSWIIDLPKNKLQAFFDGYIAGDGHYRARCLKKELHFCTVSSNIYYSLQQIIAKLYGRISNLYIRKDNRRENFSDTYNGQFTIDGNVNNIEKIIGDKICGVIRNIEKIEECVEVYNLEVEKDNSYTCNNVIVHNCQDLSLAGKRAGMDVSQADGGTRSGLLWEVERILTECQQINSLPQILIMENVPQIHSEKDYPNFEKWMLRLEELGYNSYWADLNSKDFGIPQNRERTFMVSILGKEYNYKFPLPIPRKYNLEDFLEKGKIDEKYYLSQAMVDYLTGINQKKSKYDRGDVFKRNLDPSKEIAATITTAAGQRATDNFIIDDNIKVVGNYSPSGHNASRVIDPTGLAPTVMENHGTVTAVAIRENTVDGYREAHEGDGINISSRMQHQRGNVQYGLSQTLKTSIEVGTLEINGNNFRIRKLTPKECGRLMGFQDKDTDDMFQVGLTNATLYHCYGDSIVVTVLIGIIGKLYGLNPIEIKEVIYKYIESIKGE